MTTRIFKRLTFVSALSASTAMYGANSQCPKNFKGLEGGIINTRYEDFTDSSINFNQESCQLKKACAESPMPSGCSIRFLVDSKTEATSEMKCGDSITKVEQKLIDSKTMTTQTFENGNLNSKTIQTVKGKCK